MRIPALDARCTAWISDLFIVVILIVELTRYHFSWGRIPWCLVSIELLDHDEIRQNSPCGGHERLEYRDAENADQYKSNARYGHFIFLGLILISILGIPIFQTLMTTAGRILPYLIVIQQFY